MKRQMSVAIVLLLLFTAATVMAGRFSMGSLSTSVSASAVCGEIPTSAGNVPHYYNNVTTITNGAGQQFILEARYQISWTAEGGYTTSKRATIQLTGHVYVLDANNTKVGAGDTYSTDFDVSGGWFGREKTDTVSDSNSFLWTTTSSGCYTARNDGEGGATSVSGGGGHVGVGATIRGVTLTLTGGFNQPEVRTKHSYTTSVDGSTLPVFTHRAESGFYVGSDTKFLSSYP